MSWGKMAHTVFKDPQEGSRTKHSWGGRQGQTMGGRRRNSALMLRADGETWKGFR